MSGVIRVTPEELEQRSSEYLIEGENIQEVIAKLDNLRNALESEWEGQASQAFISQYEELKPSFIRMKELVDDISSQLRQTAGILRDTDQEIAAQIRG